MNNGWNQEPTEYEKIDRMSCEINELREENEKIYKVIEEKELKNKELKEINRKLMAIAFPGATEHFMEMVKSITKTIKESGFNE